MERCHHVHGKGHHYNTVLHGKDWKRLSKSSPLFSSFMTVSIFNFLPSCLRNREQVCWMMTYSRRCLKNNYMNWDIFTYTYISVIYFRGFSAAGRHGDLTVMSEWLNKFKLKTYSISHIIILHWYVGTLYVETMYIERHCV